MLQLGDGFGRPDVVLAAHPPGVVAADVQGVGVDGVVAPGVAVPAHRLLGDLLQAGALDGGGGAGEVLVHEFRAQADGIEDLGAAVGLVGGDAHLGHDLEQSLADGLDVAPVDLFLVQLLGQIVPDGRQRLEGEVRVDGLGAVTGQHRELVHLARGAGLDHQAGLGAQPGAHQVVVHGRGRQQGGNGQPVGAHRAVRQDEDVVAVAHRLFGVAAQRVQRALHAGRAQFRRVADVQRAGAEGTVGGFLDITDALQILVGQDRLGDFQAHVPAAGVQPQQVGARPDQRHQRHDQFLADGVDGRVGDLGEVLLEVVEQRLGLVRQHRHRVVGAHGADGFLAGDGHGRHQHADVFLGVAEGLLAVQQGGGVGLDAVDVGRQVLQVDLGLVQPLLVGVAAGQFRFQFGVVDDAALLHVDEEHLARLQAPLLDDLVVRNVQHAHFRGHHHQVVVGDQVARGPETVAVQGGADLAAVGEGHRGRAVPGFHQGGVVFVEGAALFVHQGVAGPGLGDQHHHGVGHGIAAGHQQFQGVVEAGRVALAFRNQRPDLLQVVAEQVRGHGMAARRHPVDVAAQGVDLAVVGDHAERVGQVPGREGVGGEALVHQRQRRHHALVAQVVVIGVDLVGQQHALVDQGAGGQRGHVEVFAVLPVGFAHRVFHHLADDEQAALEVVR